MELDKKEKEAVAIAEKVLAEGGETSVLHCFEVDGIWICNPFTTEDGRASVDPLVYYGDKYISWYNSL